MRLCFSSGGSDVGSGPVFADFTILATAVIAGHGVALCPIEVFREATGSAIRCRRKRKPKPKRLPADRIR
ncbi:hypothetical protein FJ957_15850 [Mesorhizobium sp. B2-4-6]|nr:hypothetical protein FJW10_21960 [Mesorhizobium sp. B4-1-1]TPL47445.1 hypothetical protein FJ957_15850 [Mesorhizobium sp. B2-4-6]